MLFRSEQARRLQDLHLAADRNRIPLLLMVDVIHGMKTTYPIPLAMGCSFDDELLAECAGMARREAAAAGVLPGTPSGSPSLSGRIPPVGASARAAIQSGPTRTARQSRRQRVFFI